MEIIQHVQNIQYGYLLNKYKMGHLEGNFSPVLYIGRKVPRGETFLHIHQKRPRGSCKSSFCIKLLQYLESLSTETRVDGSILWCYGKSNAVPSVDVGRRIQFHEGVPDNFANAGNKPCVIILDDLLNEVSFKEVCIYLQKAATTEISA